MERSHTKRNITILIVGLVVFGAVALYINRPDGDIADKYPHFASDEVKTYTEVAVSEQSSFYNIQGVYPSFTSIDPTMNKKIEDFVMSVITEFKEGAEGNWKAMREISPEDYPTEFPSTPFPFQMSFDVVYEDDRYLSLLLTYGGYIGGAHGNENLYAFNFDKAENKELVFSDMFAPGFDYVAFLSEYTRADLVEQFEKSSTEDISVPIDSIRFGTEPVESNFQVFTFDEKYLYIHFPEYAVAPYVYGQQMVKIEREYISEVQAEELVSKQ